MKKLLLLLEHPGQSQDWLLQSHLQKQLHRELRLLLLIQ